MLMSYRNRDYTNDQAKLRLAQKPLVTRIYSTA
jgi:hypothetical protein